MSQKCVVFVHHRYGYGGASKALKFYAHSLSNRGTKVGIVFYDSDGAEAGAFSPEIQLVSVANSRKNPVIRRLSHLLSIYRAVQEFGACTVIGLMPVNAMIAVIVGRMTGANVIGSERGNPYTHRGIAEAVKRFFMARADGAIFQTEGARDFYGSKLGSKSIIIPNYVEPSQSQIIFERKHNQCAFFSRFDLRNKRFDLLFDAFNLVLSKYPDMILNIYGSGSLKEEKEVRALCIERGLSERVCFQGAVSNSYSYMERYRYFISTSDSEGMPNSLMEAMACGMVCISTDCEPGGARFLIQDNINGRLVPRGDKYAIANGIIESIKDIDGAKKMSAGARNICVTLDRNEIEKKLNSYILSF